jgi:nucleoside-diphosphate-sugar epimerase
VSAATHPDSRLAWVVGAGGLVGRHVAAELIRSGHEVVTTDVPWSDEEASVLVLAQAV